jgi:WD40 repeat protein/tRNA A-37 threonylcarbamoyl transferase component Bud32
VAGYEILGELGRGAMGVVYKARQTKLKRLVALKMILAGPHASTSELARFRREAEAIARLQHPNIVQIYEVGEQDGRPFFSLEYVDGGSLAQQLTGTPLPARRAAELVQTLARAMHAAHQQGVVHRDLKPGNILLASGGREPPESAQRLPSGGSRPPLAGWVPKITDFGLAKQMDESVAQTQSGAIVGTPSYMAPEQAGGKGGPVGPAADVYALGAILYELVTGRPPFRAETPLDTVLQLLSEEPVPPRRLQPKLPRDLETICLKALAKEPGRRYASAEELANDLHRFLDDRPIQARPVGRAEKVWRWCRRNPALAAASGLGLAAAMIALVVSVSFGIYQTQAAEDLRTALKQVKDEHANTKNALREAETERDKAATRLAENFLDRGLVACTRDGDAALGLLWMCRALETVPGRNRELQRRIRMQWSGWKTAVPPLKSIFSHQGMVSALAFSPDGKAVLTGSWGYTLRPYKPWGEARLWSSATGKELTPPMRHQDSVLAVVFSPDGKAVLTGSEDKTARLWSAASGKELTRPLNHPGAVNAVAFSPDGRAVLTGSQDGTARLWSAATGKELTPRLHHGRAIDAVAFSPDGNAILTGSSDQNARLWSVASGKELIPPLRHQGWVTAVAFSPDGKAVLTSSWDHTARLWSAATGKELTSPLRHQGIVWAVAYSPDGKAVLTGSGDNTARLWSAATGQELTPPLRHPGPVRAVAYSPDGKAVLTGCEDGTARLWSVATGRERTVLLRHQDPVSRVAFSPDGKAVLTGSGGTINVKASGEARLWSAASGKELSPPLRHQDEVRAVAFSPDGKAVLTASQDYTARLWSAASGKELIPPLHHQNYVVAVAFSPDGKALLTGSYDTTARLWSAATAKELTPPLRHMYRVNAVAFSPDGKVVLTGSDDQTARLWSVATGKELTPRLHHRYAVTAMAFSPDGKAILTGSGDGIRGEARLWSAATGKELTTPLRHQGTVSAVAFSPDGKAVLTGGGGFINNNVSKPWGEARLWSAATGQPLGPPLRHQGMVLAVAITPDGQALLTGSSDKTVRRWEMPVAVKGDGKRIKLWTQVLTGMEIEENGEFRVLDASTWHKRRRQVTQMGVTPSSPEADPLVWHRREAIEAEIAGQWFANAWHLTRLLKATPTDGELWKARAQAHVHLGNWEKASWDWLNAAMAQQKRGHTEDAKGCLAKAGESMRKGKEIPWLEWLKLQILYQEAQARVIGKKR